MKAQEELQSAGVGAPVPEIKTFVVLIYIDVTHVIYNCSVAVYLQTVISTFDFLHLYLYVKGNEYLKVVSTKIKIVNTLP